ncbi:hypothetical protein FB45DRAFT_914289 [Roridomyces roridus]|uniref:Secreted protein n=1 Tax=Roridomyces roridus TaxID=1738132 RepID=A0AAD7FMT0_9AGAR|nr:hypothetical protein FB45DRAFT_914289 [Roridomyces roridus]
MGHSASLGLGPLFATGGSLGAVLGCGLLGNCSCVCPLGHHLLGVAMSESKYFGGYLPVNARAALRLKIFL